MTGSANLPTSSKKKDLCSALDWLSKGLVYIILALTPGLSTVLTEYKSAISLADNYSPLLNLKYNNKGGFVNLVQWPNMSALENYQKNRDFAGYARDANGWWIP